MEVKHVITYDNGRKSRPEHVEAPEGVDIILALRSTTSVAITTTAGRVHTYSKD